MILDFDGFAVHGAVHSVVKADYKGCVWNGIRGGGECHATFGGNDQVGRDGTVQGMMMLAGHVSDKQRDGAFGMVDGKVLGIRVVHGQIQQQGISRHPVSIHRDLNPVRPLERAYLPIIETDLSIVYGREAVSDMTFVGIVDHANGFSLQKRVELPKVELGVAGVERTERDRVIVRVEAIEGGFLEGADKDNRRMSALFVNRRDEFVSVRARRRTL